MVRHTSSHSPGARTPNATPPLTEARTAWSRATIAGLGDGFLLLDLIRRTADYLGGPDSATVAAEVRRRGRSSPNPPPPARRERQGNLP